MTVETKKFFFIELFGTIDANLSEMKILACNPELIYRNFDGKQQQGPKLEIFGPRGFTHSGLDGR
jgi:hypothetical protein